MSVILMEENEVVSDHVLCSINAFVLLLAYDMF